MCIIFVIIGSKTTIRQLVNNKYMCLCVCQKKGIDDWSQVPCPLNLKEKRCLSKDYSFDIILFVKKRTRTGTFLLSEIRCILPLLHDPISHDEHTKDKLSYRFYLSDTVIDGCLSVLT